MKQDIKNKKVIQQFTNLTLFLTVVFLLVTSVWATTYQVGPSSSKPYKSIQAVQDLLNPGDVVEVEGNATYPGGVLLSRSGSSSNYITIRGIRVNGKRPLINTTSSQFCVKIEGHFIRLESFELTGSTKAGLGLYGHKLIISDCSIHDCPRDGIMGWGGDGYYASTGDVTLEYTEIYNTGESSTSPYAHQIYMASDEVAYAGSKFRMQYCYIHNGNGGNNVKTRCERNEFYYNWIEGATYHALELIGYADDNPPSPDVREDSDIVGNVIICSNNYACARIGGDGSGDSKGRFRFVNNTFIIPNNGDVIRTYDGVETLEMHNNVIYNKTAASGTTIIDDADGYWVHGRLFKGSNNWVQSGTNSIPGSSEWTNTKLGTDPGFVNAGSNDFRLTSTSPLINQGNPAPTTISSYPFPSPLFPPAYMPPVHTVQTSGNATGRPVNATIDIGAYEYGGSSCSYSISPTTASYGSSGGTGSVTVSTATGCSWTATSNVSWITISSGSSGSGNGSVSYSVAANASTSSRSGTLTIAGQTITISQTGTTACTYSILPSSASFTATGGTGSVAVTAGTGCSWTAVSNVSWVTISSGSSGNGNGSVSYSVVANAGASSRNGTLTIAGQTFNVSQQAAGSSCPTATVGGSWVNNSFTLQNSIFTVVLDATPSDSATNAIVALSNGASTQLTGFACMVLFDSDGKIKVRNGASYGAAITLSYTGGSSYHIRMVVNLSAHTYSTYVTAPGGSELTLASNYAFRNSQSTVSSLNNYGIYVSPADYSGKGTLKVCNFAIAGGDSMPPAISMTAPVNGSTVSGAITLSATASDNVGVAGVQFLLDGVAIGAEDTTSPYSISYNTSSLSASHTFAARARDAAGFSTTSVGVSVTVVSTSTCKTATVNGPWVNTAFAAKTGTFTAQFDATPTNAPTSSVVALSNGANTRHSNFACLVSFGSNGRLTVRNGAAYAAANVVNYVAGQAYHFRMVVNVTTHTYTTYVTPPGGTETLLGSNYAFRTEQSGVTSLNNMGIYVDPPDYSGVGSISVCNFTVAP